MDAGDARSGRRARGLNGAAAYSLSSSAARPFSRQYDHEDSRLARRERSPYLASSSSRLGRSRERSPYLSKTKERRLRVHSPYFSRSPLGLGYGRSLSPPPAALYRKRSPLGLGYARSPSPYLPPLPRARSPLGLGYSRSRSPFRARSPLWLEAGRARSPLGLGFSSRGLSPTSARLYHDLDLLRYERLTRGPYPHRSPPPPRPRRRRSRSPRYPPVNSRPSRGPPPPASKERPRPRRPQLYHLKVTGFPAHCSDESVRQGLQHAFKKHGALARLTLQGAGEERYALLGYGRAKERAEALAAHAAPGAAQLFGAEVTVTAAEGPEAGLTDEEVALRREASMTLYVGNLDKDTTVAELTAAFAGFGEVLCAEIKLARHNYGFVQFADIESVARAIRSMNGRPLGRNKVALGFGKNLPTACVWLCGLKHTGLTAKALLRHFRHYGSVLKLLHDTARGTALVLYKDRYSASVAVGKLRRTPVEGHRLKAVFASSRVQLAFCRSMEASGQDVGDFPLKAAAADSQGGLNEEESAMVAEASDEEEEPPRPVVAPASDQEEEAPDEDEDESPGEEEEEDDDEEDQEDEEEEQEEEMEDDQEEGDTTPPADEDHQGQDTDEQVDTDGPGPQDQAPPEPAADGPKD